MIDNLDVTSEGGIGRGANDGDDFIVPTLTVLGHSNGSFDSQNKLDQFVLDLGQIEVGETIPSTDVAIHNLVSVFGSELTAGLNFNSFEASNDNVTLSGTLFEDLAAGESALVTVTGDPALAVGSFATVFTLGLSDVDLPGAIDQSMTLIATYEVIDPAFLLGDVNGDGEVNLLDVGPLIDLLAENGFLVEADINGDGEVNLLDVGPFVDLLGGG